MAPSVSIVMSVYNGERFLRESLGGIINQTYRDFEFIIINDGSIDKTKDILHSCNDKRIKIITNEKNMGLGASLNNGIKEAKGEYISHMDADDIAYPGLLDAQLRFFASHTEIGVLGTAVENIDEHGKFLHKYWPPIEHKEIKTRLLISNVFRHPTIMMRKNLLDKAGGYNSRLKASIDYDLLCRLCRLTYLHNLPDILLQYRIWKGAMTATYRMDQVSNSGDISYSLISAENRGRGSIDKEAYRRFWWAYNDPRKEINRETEELRWKDIRNLQPLWSLLANLPDGSKIFGPELLNFANHLINNDRLGGGIGLIRVLLYELKYPVSAVAIAKKIVKYYMRQMAKISKYR